MTTFLLVRHAHTPALGRFLAGRQYEVPLSDEGQQQAAALGQHLAKRRIDAVYASPLLRTVTTAEAIARHHQLPVREEPAFLEMDMGEWTGQPFDVITADPRWEQWNRCRSLARIPGGETMQDVQARTLPCLHRLGRVHPDQTVVITSHGDVIRGTLMHLLGMPVDLIHRCEVAPASISEVRWGEDWAQVWSMNVLLD